MTHSGTDYTFITVTFAHLPVAPRKACARYSLVHFFKLYLPLTRLSPPPMDGCFPLLAFKSSHAFVAPHRCSHHRLHATRVPTHLSFPPQRYSFILPLTSMQSAFTWCTPCAHHHILQWHVHCFNLIRPYVIVHLKTFSR